MNGCWHAFYNKFGGGVLPEGVVFLRVEKVLVAGSPRFELRGRGGDTDGVMFEVEVMDEIGGVGECA